jgi:hypothetical protein
LRNARTLVRAFFLLVQKALTAAGLRENSGPDDDVNSLCPLLYELNTRVWLRELSELAGRPLTIADVPDSDIRHWVNLGFTHVWAMGIWQIGPQAQRLAVGHWREHWHLEIPSTEGDVHGSPYAIQDYAVDSRIGRPLDLLMFKERLNHAGLRLILDFVPNHFGIDSPEPRRYPARFVQASSPLDGTFHCETTLGTRYFAHGRDPYFPPWEDTVQIDYRVAEVQEMMSSIAQTISMFGDGLRCDMAMLLLPEIFCDVWKNFPAVGSHRTSANFWNRTIPHIRQLQPNAELIAEVYWDREESLQDAGFDYTYNKRVTDFLMRGQDAELADFLYERRPAYLRRSVHFLENHDEQRVAAILPFRRHKAAAALILFLPGMALLHDGQLEGRTHFSRIQMNKRIPEEVDRSIQAFYFDLLQKLQKTHVRRGKPELVRSLLGHSLIVLRWAAPNGEEDFAMVNLGREPVKYELPREMVTRDSKCEPLYSTEPGLSMGDSRELILPAESAHIVRIHPA